MRWKRKTTSSASNPVEGAPGTAGCVDCRHRGRQRAQLVLTVANLDTGQVASATLVPGALEPVRTPTGRWRLPLGALILDLAGQAGVDPAALHEPEAPDYPARPADHDIHLPLDWCPDLSTERRHDLLSLPDAPRLTGPVRRLAADRTGRPATARPDRTGHRRAVRG